MEEDNIDKWVDGVIRWVDADDDAHRVYDRDAIVDEDFDSELGW